MYHWVLNILQIDKLNKIMTYRTFDGTSQVEAITSGRYSSTPARFTESVTFENAINENVYNCTGTALDPDNGTMQYKVL